VKNVEEYKVCTDCFSAIVNDDTSSLILLGEEKAEEIERKIENGISALTADKGGYLTAGNSENDEEFSIYPCDCCISALAGGRFEVVRIA